MTTPSLPKGPGDRLDQQIDNALASYTCVEPQVGFERRILASVTVSIEAKDRTQPPAWRRQWRLAAIAALLALIAIPAALLMPPGNKITPPSPDAIAKLPSPPTSSHAATSYLAHRLTNSRADMRIAAHLHAAQSRFGPTRATREDLRMAHLASQHPDLAAELAESVAQLNLETPVRMTTLPAAPLTREAVDLMPLTTEPVQLAKLY